MNVKKIYRTILISTVLLSNIGCDQISKNIVRNRMEYHEQLGFLNNHLTLTKVENTGAFLSIGHSLPKLLKTTLLTIIPLIFLAIAFGYIATRKDLSNFTVVGACFVVGGGIGNIYDRILYGSVTDFLHIDFGLFQTGIFNMADVSILVGVFTILLHTYLDRKTSIRS